MQYFDSEISVLLSLPITIKSGHNKTGVYCSRNHLKLWYLNDSNTKIEIAGVNNMREHCQKYSKYLIYFYYIRNC